MPKPTKTTPPARLIRPATSPALTMASWPWVQTTGSPPAGVDTTNLIHAADIWHSLKKHWCREAQRLLAATAPS